MSDFSQLLIALGALTALAAAGVVRGHLTIAIRRKPEPRRRAPSPSGRLPEEGPQP